MCWGRDRLVLQSQNPRSFKRFNSVIPSSTSNNWRAFLKPWRIETLRLGLFCRMRKSSLKPMRLAPRTLIVCSERAHQTCARWNWKGRVTTRTILASRCRRRARRRPNTRRSRAPSAKSTSTKVLTISNSHTWNHWWDLQAPLQNYCCRISRAYRNPVRGLTTIMI